MDVSKNQQYSGAVERSAELSPTCENGDPLSHQLRAARDMMKSINERLEDCAVHLQSEVSRKQWRIIETNTTTEKPWEHSLLARTYFTQKSLDEAFHSLLVHGRGFNEQLNGFVALLRGEGPLTITATACDAQNQCPDPRSMDHQDQSTYPRVAPLDLSLLEDRSPVRKTRKSKRLAAGSSTFNTIQESFADLIKAKINLDTKFLGFEAVLNGSDVAESAKKSIESCLCKICSNVLGTAVEKGNTMKSLAVVRQKVQRVAKARNKRLKKSTRTWTRRKQKNPTVSMINIGDQASPIIPTASCTETAAE